MKIWYDIGQSVGPNNLIYLRDEKPHIKKSGQKKRMCLFKCTCGKEFIGSIRAVKTGHLSNCGCGANSNRQKHGLTGSSIRRCWGHIKNRCFKESSKSYKFYGGRGITMYEPWINNFMAFQEYTSQLEHYSDEGYSIDRINNNGNYEPGNLRWATKSEQAINRRTKRIRSNKKKKPTRKP